MSTPAPLARTVSAPAKLTLSLHVSGVRPDGYHELDAEMVTVDLADTLAFEAGTGMVVVDEVVGGAGLKDMPHPDDNLAARALALVGLQAAVRLAKRIPVGAGLGGGSADAAAVLRWAGRTEPELSMKLGSDVPFCVAGGRARVRAAGAEVDPLPFELRRFVLLLPPVVSSTAAVYRAWDERRSTVRNVVAGDGDIGEDGNDLEGAAVAVTPDLLRWRDVLAEITGRRPRLAGSGSAWFVEGDPKSLGIEGRDFLVLHGARAALVAVQTVPAEGGA